MYVNSGGAIVRAPVFRGRQGFGRTNFDHGLSDNSTKPTVFMWNGVTADDFTCLGCPESCAFVLGVAFSIALLIVLLRGRGSLTSVQVLREHGVDGSEVDRIFAGVDMDESGSLHYMEFLAATIEARGYIEVCAVCFIVAFGCVYPVSVG